ncbi:MAG TPA: Gfo/Idh/MocA family oxidoreductase [Terriglobales bacterium]|nr:Gfo/Idh/MocA family oxidoreductase [Terriglobales bacterium]
MPSSKRKLRIGMIGAGFIARLHSNAFRQVEHFFPTPYELELTVICARNQARLEATATQWGWQKTESDWHAVVERADVDVIDIATPNNLHSPMAIAAAKAGKIVLCEKPLATNVTEAEAMVEATRGVPTLVWFNYRRVPAVVLAKRMIEEGRLGQIYHYRGIYLNQSGNDPTKAAGWRYRKSEAGTGAAGDLLSHSLDMAVYLNGGLAHLSAMTQTFAPGRDVDDAVMLLAKFANGSVGTLEATRFGVGHYNSNAFEINGSRGMLRFDLEDMNRLIFYDATEAAPWRAPKSMLVTGPDHPYSENFWKPGHTIGYEHTFIATLGDFLEALSRNEAFHPNFEDGLMIQRLLHSAETSAATGSWVSPE